MANQMRIFNTEEILAKSLKNCHAPGLDSIVLGDGDGGELYRVFWAREGHSLGVCDPFSSQLQLAVHFHHCDLEFILLQGTMMNMRAVSSSKGRRMQTWTFRSMIASSGHGGFEPVASMGKNFGFACEFLTEDHRHTSMLASELHTVFVPCSEAMWLIKESPTIFGRNTTKFCHSNADLSSFSFDGLYQPFTNREEAEYVLDIARSWI